MNNRGQGETAYVAITSTRETEDVHQIKRHRKEGGNDGAKLSTENFPEVRQVDEALEFKSIIRKGKKNLYYIK